MRKISVQNSRDFLRGNIYAVTVWSVVAAATLYFANANNYAYWFGYVVYFGIFSLMITNMAERAREYPHSLSYDDADMWRLAAAYCIDHGFPYHKRDRVMERAEIARRQQAERAQKPSQIASSQMAYSPMPTTVYIIDFVYLEDMIATKLGI